MIKSFKGLLNDLEQETIRLGTNQGLIGYKIKKFQLMTNNPGADQDVEHIVKLFTNEQGTPDGVVDFNNSELLAAGFYSGDTAHEYPHNHVIIFDNVTFNQDIYITHKDLQTDGKCNYYLELEQTKLDLNEAAVATLKDMRADSNIS